MSISEHSRIPFPPQSPARPSHNWLPILVVLGVLGGGIGWMVCSQPLPIREGTIAVNVPEPQVPTVIQSDTLPMLREPLTFADIPEGHWAKSYIDELTARGIIDGLPDGSYAPNRPMTRAELAVQVAQAFDQVPKVSVQSFTDVPADFWAAETIDRAVTTGFMKGYPNAVFKPSQTLTRMEALITLATGLALTEVASPDRTLQSYQDWQQTPAWAQPKVAAAIEAGMIAAPTGENPQLRPNDPATRAEVTVMLYQSLVYLGRIEPIEATQSIFSESQ
ncbi:MAG: S-layer homology domain-containing protein [Cyanobacteria bacterium P01_H01_bin.58]